MLLGFVEGFVCTPLAFHNGQFQSSFCGRVNIYSFAKMPEDRIRVAPNTVAYADRENRKLVVEFAIPGAPTDTIDVKILEDSVHLTAPARDIEYASALALGWPVKPDKAEATYEHGLLRIEVPFKDPMEGAVKIAIKAGGAETKTKAIEG
jgi:HSP20 family molecular chaperone IbpA